MGAYLSVPSWWRNLDGRYRLVLGRCRDCGEHTFPAEGACPSCNSTADYEPVEPEGTGHIVTRTVIEGGLPPEFDALNTQEGAITVAIVELDEGARVPGMLTDCDPAAVARGDRVESVVRRIYEEEGIVRYGVKFRPLN
ncbi:MAG: Zn-ribbon domain-containing OB-fold protein [Halorientalis sp.]